MSRALHAFGEHKPMHAPKGVIEGGQFIGRGSITHAIIEKLLGIGGRPHGDARRNLGTTGTPGGAVIRHRLTSRMPSIDDEVRDPHNPRTVGRVLHVDPQAKTMRVRWGNGREETRSVDSVDWPGGPNRAAPEPTHTALTPGLGRTTTAGGATIHHRMTPGGPQHRSVEDVHHTRSYDATPTAARTMDTALGGPAKRQTAAQRMRDRVSSGKVDAETATRLLKGESATSIVDSRTPGGFRDKTLANMPDAQRHAVEGLGGDQGELYWMRRAAGMDHNQAIADLSPHEGAPIVVHTSHGSAVVAVKAEPSPSTAPPAYDAAKLKAEIARTEVARQVRMRQMMEEHRSQTPKKAAQKMARPKAPTLSTEEHVAALGRMTTREDAIAHVANLKGQALTDLAKHYNVNRGTVEEKRHRLVEFTVGHRLNSATIRTGSWDNSGAGASPSTAERLGYGPMDPNATGFGATLQDLARIAYEGGYVGRGNSETTAAPRKAAAKMARAKAPNLSTAEHAIALEKMGSREEAAAYLANIKGQALTDLARHYSTNFGSVASKRDGILYAAVGNRLEGEAIRSHGGVTPSAFLSARSVPADKLVRGIAVDPFQPGSPAAAKMTRGKAPTSRFDRAAAQDLAEEFYRTKPDRATIASRLAGLNKSELATFAHEHNVDFPPRTSERFKAMSADDFRTRIVDQIDRAYRAGLPQIHDPSAGSAAAKMARAKAPSADIDGILKRLDNWENPPSREEAHAAIAGLKKPELLAMARKLNVPRAAQLNTAELRHDIVQATVGNRLDSIATRGFRGPNPWNPDGGVGPKAGDALAKLTRAQPMAAARRRELVGRVPSTRFGGVDYTPEHVRSMSDDDLLDAFVSVTREKRINRAALKNIDDELNRREGGAPSGAPITDAQRRIDALVAGGRDYRSAYAEVHNLDEAHLERQDLAASVDAERLPGETREQTVRRMYDETTMLTYLRAEKWTRGSVLSPAGRAAGIDPVSLFSGNRARARKYASEELKRFWEEVEPRQTYTEFRAGALGRATDRAAAKRMRTAGNGRDFGL